MHKKLNSVQLFYVNLTKQNKWIQPYGKSVIQPRAGSIQEVFNDKLKK